MVLDREALESRGSLDIARNLNEQAGFIVLETPISFQGETVGRSLVNLFGLGSQRTLTLVNGHRFPSTSGFSMAVDLNSIPETLVERVETIAVGGAPIYGSDAIAGTVNIIIRDDFEGFEFSASVGNSPEFNDSAETRLTGTWGTNFSNNRGNVAVSAQVTSAEGLRESDRPATENVSGFEVPGDSNSPYTQEYFDDLVVAVDNNRSYPLFFGDLFFLNVFGNGIPLDINDPTSPLSQFDADGNMLSFVPGGGTGSVIFQQGGDGLRLAPLSPLYTDFDRTNVNAFLNYELADTVTLSVELWFARTEATQIVNQPYFNSPIFGGLPDSGYGNVGEGPIPVLIDNPFLTDLTRTTIAAALDVAHDFTGDGVADPTIDTDGDGIPDAVGFWRGGPLGVAGDLPNSTRQDTYRAVLGLNGVMNVGARNYRWDVAYNYGRVDIDNSALEIHQPRFEQAVQVVPDGNGAATCADPSDGCVPLDVVGAPSQGAIDFVTQPVTDRTETEQHVFAANIAGDLFELPAGTLSAAIGIAYREERMSYDPNDLSETGLGRIPRADPMSGDFSSTEFYGEAVVPLLGGDLDTPWVETLEFEGAFRLVDNSVVGQDTTWTAGMRYRPVTDLEFRGNITESIRAPSLGELFLPETNVFAFADDPCDERFIAQGNVPETRASNCAADGIVQPFQSFIINAAQPGTTSGNLNLDSEIASSLTYGVVLRPRFWDRFTVSIDWFDIEIKNAIENLNLNNIMAACYDSSAFTSEPACGLFTRDAGDQVVDFRQGYVNVEVVEFAGLQAVANYETELGRFGDMSISLNYLFTDRRETTPGSGNTRKFDGQIGVSTHRVALSAGWNVGKWTWYNQFRWLDGAAFDNRDDEFSRNVQGVDDWLIINSSLAYRFNDNLDMQLTVDNLFDEDPPFAAVSVGRFGISTYYSGVLGRYARVQVRVGF